jgi:hypothetical protein
MRRCAIQQIWVADFRFGSKADIAVRLRDVRFTPETRHPVNRGGVKPRDADLFVSIINVAIGLPIKRALGRFQHSLISRR